MIRFATMIDKYNYHCAII